MKIPKISVVIITYNQENEIERAIESLLIQKKWLYEIIICDDCSTDNNWEIILKYKEKYPDLFNINRNFKNLGLYLNWEQTWSKPTGDFMYLLAGDDYVNDGLFEHVHFLIRENKINFEDEAIALYFDFMTLYPNGEKKITRNNIIAKGFNPVSLKLRDLIYSRTVIVSRKIFENYKPVNKDVGIYADALIDMQTPFLAKRLFYYPFVGNVYVYGTGVASKTKQIEHWKSIILSLKELKKIYEFENKDKKWIKYTITLMSYYLNPNFKAYLLIWYYFLQSRNFKYGIDYKNPIRLILRITKLFD